MEGRHRFEYDGRSYEAKLTKMSDQQLYEEYDTVCKKMKKKTPQQIYDRRSRRSKPKMGSRELFCICRKPNTGEKYIACETCGEWFHPACVDLPASVNVDTYHFVCGKCTKLGNDDVYIPHSPAYDAIDPVANRKKRKTQPNSRPTKRQKKNDLSKESFDFSNPSRSSPKEPRKSKKRKRVNSEEGRKVRPRMNKRGVYEDDSDVDDMPPPSRRRKLQSDDDSDSDDNTTILPDNEFARHDLPQLLEEIVKCERQTERIKTQKRFQGEIDTLTKECEKLRESENELSENKVDMEMKFFDMQRNNERLKSRLTHAEDEFEKQRRRHKSRIDELQKKIFNHSDVGSYRDDDEKEAATLKALEEMEKDRDRANLTNEHLQNQINALQKQLRDKTVDTKLASKHKENMDLIDHLYVEKKFSSELEKHYQRTVDIVKQNSPGNSGRSVDSEKKEELEDQVRRSHQQPQKQNGDRKSKNNSSKAKKKVQTAPSIPSPLEQNPVTRSQRFTSEIPNANNASLTVEKVENSCMVCQSNKPSDMIENPNPNYDPKLSTEFKKLSGKGADAAYVLNNRKTFRHHAHCLRSARVQFGVKLE